jgi:hypothetical protein
MSSTTIGQEDVASGASSLGLSAALTGCGLASTELTLEPGLASVKNLNLALGSTSAEEKSLRDAVLAWVGVDDYTENMSGYKRGEAGKVIWSWLGLSGRPVIDLFSTENQNISIPKRPESPLFSMSTGRPVIDLFSTENQNISIPKRPESPLFSMSTGRPVIDLFSTENQNISIPKRPVIDLFSTENQKISIPKRPESPLFSTSTGHEDIAIPKRSEINLFSTSTGHQNIAPPKRPESPLFSTSTGHQNIAIPKRSEKNLSSTSTGHQTTGPPKQQVTGLAMSTYPAIDLFSRLEDGFAMSKHQEGEIDVFQNMGINQIRQDMGWYAKTGPCSSEHLPLHRRHMVSSGQDTIICAQYDALISELFGDAQRSKSGSAQPQ